jgi:guanylate kinase
MKVSFGCEKTVLGRNTETAGQNYFFVNDKNSYNSAKTALFLDLNFLFQKKYSESRFWIPVLATKKTVFLHMNFLFQKK